MDPNYLNWALGITANNPNLNGAMFPNLDNFHGNDYDYTKAFLADTEASGNGHLSDIGKRPNHPTYSKESVYALGGDPTAGSWVPSLGAGLGDSNKPWYYHNPSRGLFMAPEEWAYHQRNIPHVYQMFKNAPTALDRFLGR